MLIPSMININAQQAIPLYDGKVPNSIEHDDTETADSTGGILRITHVSQPTLTIYLPPIEKATGDAIVVVPGGAYGMVAAGHEGKDIAEKLNEYGIAAFVLKYRLPDRRWMTNPEVGPIQDAQRALMLVHQSASKWKINPNRIGILGFSAGGHLAATASTHFNKVYLPGKFSKADKAAVRPDFSVLIYPVISFSDSIGHIGSRDNLLGKTPSAEKIREYSNELQVTARTPPAFMVHAKDDWVNVKNSLVYADALKEKGVSAELLIYESGGHGFGLVNKASEISWVDRMVKWMKTL